jgi:hypothetical protein
MEMRAANTSHKGLDKDHAFAACETSRQAAQYRRRQTERDEKVF